MDWKRERPLRDDQLAYPVVWLVQARGVSTPEATDEDLELAFGPGKSRKIKAWGHGDGGVHWLATRSGAGLHVDPAYKRYSHQMIVRCDGWKFRGVEDATPPILVPGSTYCLDTHSPHEVVDDARTVASFHPPRYKLQLVIDSDEIMEPGEVVGILSKALASGMHPRDGAADVTRLAPRT